MMQNVACSISDLYVNKSTTLAVMLKAQCAEGAGNNTNNENEHVSRQNKHEI